MKRFYSSILLACVALLFANAVAANERLPNTPLSDAELNGQSSTFVSAPSAPVNGEVETVTDGGFETGSPSFVWNEASTHFGTPLCTTASCGTSGGLGPHSGSWWAWFGGFPVLFEQGAVNQVLLIPTGIATLSFWFAAPHCSGNAADTLQVSLDGTPIWTVNATDPACGVLAYAEHSIDVSAWANDAQHVLEFHGVDVAGAFSNFFIDDVTLFVDTSTTFEVNKNFIDGNTGSVDVTLDCFTGLPITQTQTISNAQNVTFVVTAFQNGTLDCDVTETSTVGYTASYNNGAGNSTTSCAYDDVSIGDDNVCTIKNTPDPVDVIVYKDWIIEGTGGNLLDPSYLLELHCNAQIIGFTSTAGGVYNKTLFSGTSEADQEFVSQVIPFWNGGSLCWVSESAFDSSVEIHLDYCGTSVATAGLHIFLATGDECTVTNTVFYEGIPTLNQYGMAILALLMLGVGFVGFRRFA